MCKICSFHEFTRNVEIVLYAFLAGGRYRNRALCNIILIMASSHQHCAIADYSHLSPEIVRIYTGVHLLVQVENTKET